VFDGFISILNTGNKNALNENKESTVYIVTRLRAGNEYSCVVVR